MGLIGSARAGLRRHWARAAGYQRFLYLVGALLVVSAVFHTGVLLATGGSLEGDVSWRKPILFGEAFGVTAISVSWVLTFLPRHRVLGWLLAATLGVANLGEVLWVSVQQWRGVPSHFNFGTRLDGALFVTAGIFIAFAAGVIFLVTAWSFLSLRAPASLAWAIRLGLVLLSASQFFGLAMILNGGHTFGAVGDMKLPHALALHGLQVLPLLAGLLVSSAWSEERRVGVVLAGAAGYVGLVVAGAVQAFSGAAPLDLRPPFGPVLLVSTAALGLAYAMALRPGRSGDARRG